jgi:hypothetical protein
MTKATSVLLFRVQKIPNSLSIESAKIIGTQAFHEKKVRQTAQYCHYFESGGCSQHYTVHDNVDA